ncbi:1,4-dihydroxy-2-naphthoate octaprenyltransferase [Allobacillus halotolerans]|uniref:1,4-dihydroxy-2-naphthoate octaprenyltransferase n=1 Tax=Allobacillus halotolerans TaxID=570278 RepID=A0ABS6GS23_9BACI|nr:1,4-dihydroxy-2-naphthoate octaprenyltransferase [Allobacillus halotolerans]MBU6081700.1 1,4-dihydroxy-2-naphthoate octaprenyltransferase [Allobacillus halotolerans]
MSLAIKHPAELYHYRHSWFHLFRPLTFTGTIAPASAGAVLSIQHHTFQIEIFILFLFAILLVQGSINMLNDYYDFKRGQDQEKWIQPIEDSGIVHGPSHDSLPKVAALMLAIASLIGLWLAILTTFWIVLVGVAGMIAGWLYSGGPRPLSSMALGEVTAFIFMGPAPLFVSLWIQGEHPGFHAFLIALPFAWMISTMILTNNIRDIQKDTNHRMTIPILLGKRNAVKLLTVILMFGYLTMFLLVLGDYLPWTVVLSILAIPLAIRLVTSYRKDATRAEELAGMKHAAVHHWAFSLLFITGFLIGITLL